MQVGLRTHLLVVAVAVALSGAGCGILFGDVPCGTSENCPAGYFCSAEGRCRPGEGDPSDKRGADGGVSGAGDVDAGGPNPGLDAGPQDAATVDAAFADAGPGCDPACDAGTMCAPDGICVACLVDAHCADGQVCSTQNSCVECVENADCFSGACSSFNTCL